MLRQVVGADLVVLCRPRRTPENLQRRGDLVEAASTVTRRQCRAIQADAPRKRWAILKEVMTPKEQVLEALRKLPDEADLPEIIEKLYLLMKVRKGLDQADAGQRISHEEVRRRMARWLG